MATKPRNTLQDSRDSLLEILADTIQNFEQGRPKGNTRRRSSPPERGEEADFLQDLIQLNVQYLNQVARLGSNYSIVACRALERVYDYFGPSEEELESEQPESKRDEPTLVGLEDEVRVLRVTLKNPRPRKVEFQLSIAVSSEENGDEQGVLPALGFVQNDSESWIDVTLEPRTSRQLRIAVHFNADLVAGRRYDVALHLSDVEVEEQEAEKKKLGFEQSPKRLSFRRDQA
ncbi:MAG: hypothetical protein M3020_02650 [Myxococcota bacterium]|nr:hypothetical protein [Myxococcota bacterium]